MHDYANRLKNLRARMAEKSIGLIFLPPGANLSYLTGIRRQEVGGTDHNAYGDWAAGAYIGLAEGITLLVPRMGNKYYESEADDKPWISAVRKITEQESPTEIVRDLLGHFDLANQKVLFDDRTWAQTVLMFQRLLPGTSFGVASELIASMRMIKTAEELRAMRHAGEIAEQAFAHSVKQLQVGVTEIEIAAEVDLQFKRLGAAHTSFVTGIFFGGQAHDRNLKPGPNNLPRLAPGDSIMFDLGCVYDGYCSDFGRTAFCGDPPVEYLQVHNLILESQQVGIDALRAGQITGAQVNALARAVIEDGGYGRFFTHRLGHGIGVTVHEPPWLDSMEQMVVQTNMTFTVEPSIVVPGRFGNRVEDVVRVTEHGGELLYSADRGLYLVE